MADEKLDSGHDTTGSSGDRDMAAADRLAEILGNCQRELTQVLEKFLSHDHVGSIHAVLFY